MVLWAVTYCLRLPGLKVPRRHRIVSSAFGSFEVPHLVRFRAAGASPRGNLRYQSLITRFQGRITLFRRVRKVFYYLDLGFASTFLQICLSFYMFLSSSGSKTYLLLQNLHTVSIGLPSLVISSRSFLPKAARPESILSRLQLHLNSTS